MGSGEKAWVCQARFCLLTNIVEDNNYFAEEADYRTQVCLLLQVCHVPHVTTPRGRGLTFPFASSPVVRVLRSCDGWFPSQKKQAGGTHDDEPAACHRIGLKSPVIRPVCDDRATNYQQCCQSANGVRAHGARRSEGVGEGSFGVRIDQLVGCWQ